MEYMPYQVIGHNDNNVGSLYFSGISITYNKGDDEENEHEHGAQSHPHTSSDQVVKLSNYEISLP